MKIINIILKEKSCTQTEIAKILGVDQPKVSCIKNLHTFGFSLPRLLSFLLKLEYDTDLEVNNLTTIKVDSNTKLELIHLIKDIIAKHSLSQNKAATLMQIDQPKVSRINRLRTDLISLELLLTLLVRMGCKIEFVVTKSAS
ncbi:XRE family transcriptional regulator [Wolbachia endosymbiont of Tetranychus urticae]|uniref:XRE family transcriptional regulator n=1 Tax=Wolbachia endosymbiont of Tetranychus urticae TaxID=169184 RepID=UPI00397D6752